MLKLRFDPSFERQPFCIKGSVQVFSAAYPAA